MAVVLPPPFLQALFSSCALCCDHHTPTLAFGTATVQPSRCVYDWQIAAAAFPFIEDKAVMKTEEVMALNNAKVGNMTNTGTACVFGAPYSQNLSSQRAAR